MAIIGVIFLLTFGFVYAITVALRPIKPAWLEVTIGVVATLTGLSFILYDLCAWGWSFGWMMVAVWGSFCATGVPMIFAQAIKEQEQIEEALRQRKTDTGPLRGRE